MRSSSLGPCLIVLAVGFCLALVVSFVWAEDKSKPQDARPHEAAEHAPAAHDAAAGHEEHHEPDPSDEVNDQHHWHLFDNSWFKVIFALGWWEIAGYKVPTKFMLIELIAAVMIAILMIALGRQMRSGEPVKGPFWNALEGLVLFIRDDVAKQTVGEHDADRFTPYLLTVFLFILACNLLGLVPFMGSPTANIFVTGALALCSFVLMHGAAIAKMGPFHYLKSMWPHIDVPPMYGLGTLFGMAIALMIFTIELLGTVIKSGVLAVRLFANMFAGHTVVASILFFIYAARTVAFFPWLGVSVISVFGVVALSLLELFVAFLQAYIFTFLTALFTGMAVHPEH